MLAGGFLEVIGLWSPRPISWLLLSIVSSQLGLATLPLSCVRLVVPRFWAPSCQDVTPGGHAGVGVISLHGAPLSPPILFDPSFKEFSRLGRAMRVVLPLGNGGIAHLFVIYGYQGAESDPEKLTLTDNLLTAVLAGAKVCCAGQPVILVGDLNADPTIIPSLAKGIMNGHWIDVEHAFAIDTMGISFLRHHCMLCLARSLVHPALCHHHGVFALCMGRHCSYGQSLFSPLASLLGRLS